ncbi:hypothetical protein GCM10009096_23540 [Parasphingorhabdus litoris]|uniref:HNH endonuclease n=1 Tax=Parasphingorhabdus litoris TaxID=394733 RepID=A0ABN1APB4_9SPHN|nr:hypothetical protein [Parasphingorhabdus litoris]
MVDPASQAAQSGSQNFQMSGQTSGPDMQTIAQQIIGSNQTTTGLDIAGIRRDLDALTAFDSSLGGQINQAIVSELTPVQQGELARTPTLIQAQATGTPVAANDPGPDVATLALDLGQIALDIVGIFEPTPFADGANTLISLGRGEWLNAGLSALGIIPYVGDLAKLGKLGKWAQTISNGIELAVRNPAARAALEPALQRIADAVNAIPDGAMRSLPDDAQQAIRGMKAQLDEFFGAGARQIDEAVNANTYRATVRGQEVILEGVDTLSVNYLKRDRTAYAALRREFNGGIRADFVQSLAADPQKVAALRQAGLDDAAIERLASGRIPQGWQVHHKLPLDDGGTNAFDNLVLIKNDPYHIGLTNAQRSLVGDLAVGQSRQIDFPVPPGFVYPTTS